MPEANPLRNRDDVMAEIDSRLLLLWPDGKEIQIEANEQNISDLHDHPSLANLVASLTSKGQKGQVARSIEAMQRLEWAGYEPASDNGNLRYYPKGALVYNLLRDWHEQIAIVRMGACEIKTPFLYNWSEADLRSQAETFFDRLYYVHGHDKQRELVLRFGGDFGLFRMLKDTQLSYRHLPFRLFEYAPSFRYERKGELRGLQRARAFSFFDIHSICMNFEQAWQEYYDMYVHHADIAKELDIDYALEFTVVESFFHEYRDQILSLLKYSSRPAVFELLSKRAHYYAIEHFFYDENTSDFFNAQLDFENSARYGITYIAEDGKEKGCTIYHGSLGTMERWMFLILEKALRQAEPTLPLWLAPTQVRLVPVSNEQVPDTIALARQIAQQRIRVDVDDRNKTVGWRVRAAKSEWVPYIVVYGDQEARDARWPVQIRGAQAQQLTIEELTKELHRQTSHMPFRSLAPIRLSLRPRFN